MFAAIQNLSSAPSGRTRLALFVLASFLLLAIGTATSAIAQGAPPDGRSIGKRVEITPFASYFFEGEIGTSHDFGFSFRDTDVEAGEGSGLLAAFRINRRWQVELMYSQQETEFEFRNFLAPNPITSVVDVDLAYYHAGIAYTWTLGQIEPFVDFTLGATDISPEGPGADASSNFSIGFGGGVKVFFAENFGLRFQGRILSTETEDDDFFCGSRNAQGFPSSCYRYDDSYLVQPEVSVGLILAF